MILLESVQAKALDCGHHCHHSFASNDGAPRGSPLPLLKPGEEVPRRFRLRLSAEGTGLVGQVKSLCHAT